MTDFTLSHWGVNALRVRRLAIRRRFLDRGVRAGGHGHGSEPFVEVSWHEAAPTGARIPPSMARPGATMLSLRRGANEEASP